MCGSLLPSWRVTGGQIEEVRINGRYKEEQSHHRANEEHCIASTSFFFLLIATRTAETLDQSTHEFLALRRNRANQEKDKHTSCYYWSHRLAGGPWRRDAPPPFLATLGRGTEERKCRPRESFEAALAPRWVPEEAIIVTRRGVK